LVIAGSLLLGDMEKVRERFVEVRALPVVAEGLA